MACVLLVSPERDKALAIAATPRAVLAAPEGLGWFLAHAPIDPALVRHASTAFVAACVAVVLGFLTRPALVIALGAGGYLFALAQLGAPVVHDMHLLWFTAVLLASPCADALSLDAMLRDRPRGALAADYGAPLVVARSLLACVYFFPGAHKLATSGLAWASAENLRNLLHSKWYEHAHVPALRLDQHPWLLTAGGAFVLAFELGFPLLVHVRRARIWLALAGVVFHVSSEVFFLIPFLSLWGTYACLVDARAILGDAHLGPRPRTARRGWLAATTLTGALLLAPAIGAGARGQMQAYPFACYPTFAWQVGPTLPALTLRIESDGRDEIRVHRPATQDGWGHAWRALGLYGSDPSEEALRAIVAEMRASSPFPPRARVVHVHVGEVVTDPAAWDEAPRLGREVWAGPVP